MKLVSFTLRNTGALLTSSNGTTWTDRTVRSAFSTAKLRFDAARWVAVGQNTGQVAIATSTNGISWSNVTLTPVFNGECRALAYGDSQWATLGVRYTYTPQFKVDPVTLTSSNGTSWSVRTGGVAYASTLAFGQGKCVACIQSNVTSPSCNQPRHATGASHKAREIQSLIFRFFSPMPYFFHSSSGPQQIGRPSTVSKNVSKRVVKE